MKATTQDHVTLALRAVGGGELTYTWERKQENSTEWEAVSEDGGRYRGQGTSSLTLVGVETADVGAYRCHVSSDAGKTWTKEAILTVGKSVHNVLLISHLCTLAHSGCIYYNTIYVLRSDMNMYI